MSQALLSRKEALPTLGTLSSSAITGGLYIATGALGMQRYPIISFNLCYIIAYLLIIPLCKHYLADNLNVKCVKYLGYVFILINVLHGLSSVAQRFSS